MNQEKISLKEVCNLIFKENCIFLNNGYHDKKQDRYYVIFNVVEDLESKKLSKVLCFECNEEAYNLSKLCLQKED